MLGKHVREQRATHSIDDGGCIELQLVALEEADDAREGRADFNVFHEHSPALAVHGQRGPQVLKHVGLIVNRPNQRSLRALWPTNPSQSASSLHDLPYTSSHMRHSISIWSKFMSICKHFTSHDLPELGNPHAQEYLNLDKESHALLGGQWQKQWYQKTPLQHSGSPAVLILVEKDPPGLGLKRLRLKLRPAIHQALSELHVAAPPCGELWQGHVKNSTGQEDRT